MKKQVLPLILFLIASSSCNGSSEIKTSGQTAPTPTSSSGPACPSVTWNPTTTKRIFVSSGTILGSAGVAGADSVCQTEAASHGISSAKALIVDGTHRIACNSPKCAVCGNGEHVDWVLKPNTHYTRIDGTPIGTTDDKSLFTQDLENPIAAPAAGTGVWTWMQCEDGSEGTPCDSAWTLAEMNCLSSTLGITGSTASPSVAFGGGTANCTRTQQSLYCVEQ